MTEHRLYPLTFEPLLKEVIWGGQDIRPFKGLPASDEQVGESWEISHVEGSYSLVAAGELQGQDLGTLMHTYGERLVGRHVLARFPDRFPLLIKFIDARDNLSIQVHPDDKLAKERHHSLGKTEMWYVVRATPTARLYSGFRLQSSPEDYVRRIADGTIMEALQAYDVVAGQVFFLPAGRVHAIGAGCFVAEIQQTSDVTYRIYDYDRKDKNGQPRELHTDLAKDAIDYTVYDSYRTDYSPRRDTEIPLVSCPYFTTNLLELTRPYASSLSGRDSFTIYMILEGALRLTDDNGYTVHLGQGQTVLLPAELASARIEPQDSCKLLETYIPYA